MVFISYLIITVQLQLTAQMIWHEVLVHVHVTLLPGGGVTRKDYNDHFF